MCLEMVWIKKCNLRGGGYFPTTMNIFLMPKIWNYFFCSAAFVDKPIRVTVIYNIFYQLVVITGKYLPQKEKVRENISIFTSRVIFADISLFR